MRIVSGAFLEAFKIAPVYWTPLFLAGIFPEQGKWAVTFLIAVPIFAALTLVCREIWGRLPRFECLKWHAWILALDITVNFATLGFGIFAVFYILGGTIRYGIELTIFLCLASAVGWLLLEKGIAFCASKVLREQFQADCKICAKASSIGTI